MPGIIWTEGGDEWQRHILVLLKRKHEYDFKEIPDSDSGDCGLEGFTLTGYAYQCYAAEEPATTSDRYDRQRDKMTRDINKFTNNSKDLLKYLGTTKISHWLFVVPLWNTKKLLAHAEKKAKEVRELKLPYVADDFHINIIDQEYFEVELAQLRDNGLTTLRVEPDSFSFDTCTTFASANHDMLLNLERKIDLMSPWKLPKKKEELKRDFILHYINGQNVLDKLKSRYPDLHIKALKTKGDRERFLSITSGITNASPADIFNDTMKQYSEELTDKLRGLDLYTVNTLSFEAMSDWLLRCPLDFPSDEVSP